MRHYIYRCYDADDLLLYVGCAANATRRIAQHRQGKARASRSLSALMTRYVAEGPYPDRESAETAERAAIRTESPLLNIQHSQLPGWVSNNRIARYLAERGLPLDVAGLHRCEKCNILRGFNLTRGLCQDCREDLVA